MLQCLHSQDLWTKLFKAWQVLLWLRIRIRLTPTTAYFIINVHLPIYFFKTCLPNLLRSISSHHQEPSLGVIVRYVRTFSRTFRINIKTADNGTWTRTSRAEVCYATPTTSYPHSIFTTTYSAVLEYIKKLIQKSRAFYIILYIFLKNGCKR